MNIRPPCSKVI